MSLFKRYSLSTYIYGHSSSTRGADITNISLPGAYREYILLLKTDNEGKPMNKIVSDSDQCYEKKKTK